MHRTPRPTAAEREAHATAAAALVRRMVEACNGGNPAVLDAVLGPPRGDGTGDHSQPRHRDAPPAGTTPLQGRLRELLAAFQCAVPDGHWTIVELVAQDDTVVTRLSVRGTFSGGLVGLAPPGRPATLTAVAIGRFAEGRLVGLWLQADLLGLLEQLGVLLPLGLTQTVTLALVRRAGALLADEPVPTLPRSPPSEPERQRNAPSSSDKAHERY
jgi:predicted ester cyclase